MIRLIRAVFAFVLAGSASYAGSVAYIAPEASAIEAPAMMGGAAAWLVPLVIVGVMALAMGNSNGSTGR